MPSRGCKAFTRGTRNIWFSQRDREPEAAPGSDLARDADLTTQPIDQALADRESQTGTAIAPGHRTVRLPERLEQVLHGFSRNANPGVFHLAQQDEIALRFRGDAHARADLARVSKLDGIGDEVRQHLAEPARIPPQQARDGSIYDSDELDTFAARRCDQKIDDMVHNAANIEFDVLELDLTSLQA